MKLNVLEDFSEWMRENTTLSESSIGKYSRAVNTISEEMEEKGVIFKSLLEMSSLELEIFIDKIFRNVDFIAKNTKGDRMYSIGLKQFRSYKKVESAINPSKLDVISMIDSYDTMKETERVSVVKSRIGQGLFRDSLLEKYNCSCIITGINEKRLLVASHVKPWAVCNNVERLSSENGLLLSPTFDKLFDSGLITFSENGKLFISSYLQKATIEKLSVADGKIFDLKMTSELAHNLQYHQEYIFTTRGHRRGIKRL